jgi:hypothetical protein
VPSQFNSLGISFLYPENWTLDEERTARGRGAVTIYSPGGAFFSVSVYPRGSDPIALAKQAVEAVQEEYTEVDVEEAQETVSGRDLVGYDLNFFCMDLTTTAKVRCLRGQRATYVVFYQAEDRDFERLANVFQAITVSLLGNLGPTA